MGTESGSGGLSRDGDEVQSSQGGAHLVEEVVQLREALAQVRPEGTGRERALVPSPVTQTY